jgi:hypothetical protein
MRFSEIAAAAVMAGQADRIPVTWPGYVIYTHAARQAAIAAEHNTCCAEGDPAWAPPMRYTSRRGRC